MSKIDEYRSHLAGLDEWDDYLRQNSGLPGPRGNLELAQAAASLGDVERFRRYTQSNAAAAENTPDAFLVFVGVWGLGWQIAHHGEAHTEEIRPFASDSRWRVREAAAIALQTIGDADVELWMKTASEWSQGNRLEQRAAVAAIAEPRLLKARPSALYALGLLENVTATLVGAADAGTPDNRVLRQALGYAWSVVVAAEPVGGRDRFEALLENRDADVQWVVRENLGKKRLQRMDPHWVDQCRERAG